MIRAIMSAEAAPAFMPGDLVRIVDLGKPGHVRTPFYVREKTGAVERYCGVFENPEERGYGRVGLARIPLYRVRFNQHDNHRVFVIGALGGLLIGFMRRGLPDSIHWLVGEERYEEAEATLVAAERHAEQTLGQPLPSPIDPGAQDEAATSLGLGALLSPPLLGRVLLLALIWFIYYVGNYGWLTLAPELFAQHGFSLKQSISSLTMTGLGFVAGALAAVYWSDRIDRRRTAAALALIWAITLAGIGFLASPLTIPVLGFVASFTIGFFIPILYTITGENFPTRVRATGVSLSDGIGHLGGAFCGQIILGAEALSGFSGAFLTMAATGLGTAVLVGFVRDHTGSTLD